MIEKKVNIKIMIADFKMVLPAYESKTGAQFYQKFFKVPFLTPVRQMARTEKENQIYRDLLMLDELNLIEVFQAFYRNCLPANPVPETDRHYLYFFNQ